IEGIVERCCVILFGLVSLLCVLADDRFASRDLDRDRYAKRYLRACRSTMRYLDYNATTRYARMQLLQCVDPSSDEYLQSWRGLQASECNLRFYLHACRSLLRG